jgi:hypothetical protein
MVETDKYRNLLSQTFTKAGKLNFYAVDKLADLDKLSDDELEIAGCRAYVIENGKFYIMGSDREWHEQLLTYNISMDEEITRAGVYTFDFDPTIYDGIQTIKITVTPTLQTIEDTITENGEYEYEYDPVDYDGIEKLKITVETVGGNGDKVAVDFTDEEPDYLLHKIATTVGSGIKISFNPEDEDKKMLITYSPADYEVEYLETLPLASIQGEDTPTYQSGAITFIGSSFIPSNGFSFVVDHSIFTAYSSEGNMVNCRFLVLKLNNDNSATVIAYSDLFSMNNVRANNKLQVVCKGATEKIKAGERYYIGIAGTAVTTDWAKMMGYRAWAAQDINLNPPFNVYSTRHIDMSNPLVTLSAGDLVNNGSFYVYYSIVK